MNAGHSDSQCYDFDLQTANQEHLQCVSKTVTDGRERC